MLTVLFFVGCVALGFVLGRLLSGIPVLPRRRRSDAAPEKPRARHPLDLPFEAPPILHLCKEPEMRPLCGASIREPWTIDPQAATCPDCRREGDSLMLQWWATNR